MWYISRSVGLFQGKILAEKPTNSKNNYFIWWIQHKQIIKTEQMILRLPRKCWVCKLTNVEESVSVITVLCTISSLILSDADCPWYGNIGGRGWAGLELCWPLVLAPSENSGLEIVKEVNIKKRHVFPLASSRQVYFLLCLKTIIQVTTQKKTKTKQKNQKLQK